MQAAAPGGQGCEVTQWGPVLRRCASPALLCPLRGPQALGHSWQGLSAGRCWTPLWGSAGAEALVLPTEGLLQPCPSMGMRSPQR